MVGFIYGHKQVVPFILKHYRWSRIDKMWHDDPSVDLVFVVLY